MRELDRYLQLRDLTSKEKRVLSCLHKIDALRIIDILRDANPSSIDTILNRHRDPITRECYTICNMSDNEICIFNLKREYAMLKQCFNKMNSQPQMFKYCHEYESTPEIFKYMRGERVDINSVNHIDALDIDIVAAMIIASKRDIYEFETIISKYSPQIKHRHLYLAQALEVPFKVFQVLLDHSSRESIYTLNNKYASIIEQYRKRMIITTQLPSYINNDLASIIINYIY